MRISICVTVLAGALLAAAQVSAVEKCTEEKKVECPGNDEHCKGTCTFKVCAEYDAPDTAGLTKNLKIKFVGNTVALQPPPGEGDFRDCKWNFNLGEGSIEYETDTGTRNTVGQAQVSAEFARIQGALNEEDQRELDRILAKGHCRNWTEAERKWVIEKATPTSLSGWKFQWECEESEPGTGLSVRGVAAPDGVKIKKFKLDFKIQITCSCQGNKTDSLEVKLEGP